MTAHFPEQGQSWKDLQSNLTSMRRDDADWQHGRTALFVFNAGEDVRKVGEEAYLMFMTENALGARAFPSLAELERQIVAMALSLLQAPEDGAGCMTSGGSESILMAVKACRDWARANGGPEQGEILLPATAHPAFEKAAHTLALSTRRVPVTAALTADPEAMAAAVGPETIMMVGSAPCFPYGIVDPIIALSEIAKKHELWLHVDACVGGYFLPFAADRGYAVPPFDFSIDGVTSMSADLHKYGYTPKGASTVLYRSAVYFGYQPYESNVWPNGAMRTATVAGTRPGGAIAAAWAVLNYLGRDGYGRKAEDVMAARAELEDGLAALDFTVLGRPTKGLLAFQHKNRDTHAIADTMAQKGWVSSRVANPDGIHVMLSPAHRGIMAQYLADLAIAVKQAPKPQAGKVSMGQYA